MSSAASRSDGLHVFEREWHDWIVKSDGQLKAFTRYIRENPYRSWLRSCHRENFRRVEEMDFLGRKWFGYGNVALLDLPVIEPFRCSRKWEEGGKLWGQTPHVAWRVCVFSRGDAEARVKLVNRLGTDPAEGGHKILYVSATPRETKTTWHY